MKSIITGFIVLMGVLSIFGAIITRPILAAEKHPPKFKNVDEAIGWVKAVGQCEKIGIHQQGTRCKIRLALPNNMRPEANGRESVWEVWAWLNTFDLEPFRNFTVTIIRSRHITLSSSSPKIIVRSVKSSRYHFDKNGKIFEAYMGISLENSVGEQIINADIPLPKEKPHIHGEGAFDLTILEHHLGITWNYIQ